MDLILQVVSTIASLVALVCFVIVVVKMFQNKQVGLGVVSIILCFIGYIIALAVGWKNRTAWKLEKVMPVFTAAFLISIATTSISIVAIVKQGLEERQQPNTEFEGDLEVPSVSP
jgi:hypothetical protein